MIFLLNVHAAVVYGEAGYLKKVNEKRQKDIHLCDIKNISLKFKIVCGAPRHILVVLF